jgi:tetratricopeptide (TPR) repeat protein
MGGGFATTDLAAAEKLFRDAGAAAPDDADWANNHGLFARDHGERLRREGKTEEARGFFEASYAAYQRAVRLAPDDPRVLNDCALILVYYLDRDLDEAEAMLRRAIVAGTTQMEEAPPEGEEARNLLEEAIGDAHQNLGKLYLEKESKRDPAKARMHLEKSFEYYPKSQRGEARRMLQQARRLETRAAPESQPASQPGDGK